MRSFGVRVLRAAACSVAVACLLTSAEASAQCGAKRTTCSECHDGTHASLPRHDAWHDDHAFADLCCSCHGGNGDAHDATLAHENLTAPLADSDDGCASCHGSDASRLKEGYRALRTGDAGVAATGATRATSSTPPPVHGERGPNEAMTLVLVGVGALGAVVVGLRERDRNRTGKRGVS